MESKIAGAVRCCLAATLVLWSCVAQTQALAPLVASAKRLPERELLPRLLPVLDLARLGYSEPFVVEGEVTFKSGSVLVASEIVFRPGAKLLLQPSISSQSGELAVYIVTQRIVVEPGQARALVTWVGGSASVSSPPPAGKGAPGPSGYDGSPGGKGADGTSGSPGTVGRSPPILYLATKEIVGGTLAIDWRGQDGGPGGTGQAGGDGGRGGAGKPASSSFFDCRRGPGDGGRGGDGGNGGTGGLGGRGGDGGLFVLLAMQSDISTLAASVQLDVSPGAGGVSGLGGTQGVKGVGGERGRAAPPFCQDDAKRGPDGSDGQPGTRPSQDRGPRGEPGAFAIGELTDGQARAIGILR